ncbi:restriction endonuclease subunit S [Methanococcus maripaludis]|uniref:Type I restriction-modification system S subunit n=1 Tax=Methanococcus maripaludis OS7 TaxID=637915 RepID=A0A2Z5PH31_METMI|nr:restriction endonuclease subunit S [Methanococcus maripaludis]BAP62890.1 type I restriction-modification system S subunit [Methanococcus maripaludis OS7]
MNNKNEYRETKLGVIPKDWDVIEIEKTRDPKDRYSFTGGPFGSDLKSEHYAEEGVRVLQLQNIGDGVFLDDYRIYTSESKADELISCNIYPGEIIISKMAEPLARACIIPDFDNRYLMCSDGIRLKVDVTKYDRNYIFYTINSSNFRNNAIKHGNGTTRLRIGLSELKNLQIPLPPLPEQQKIAEILSTWDIQIENLENLISKKIETKKGLMQNLLTGKVRFPGFEDEWKEVKLGDILNEFSEKTHENNQHMILSVTKTGIIPQSEQFNKQVASSDNAGYKILRYGNLVFSSMNLWMGSLDILRTYEIGIVSPAYKTFKINYSLVDIDFIQDFLKSKHMIWIYNINSEQGASIVRRNLDLDGLLSTKIMLPELREQQKIGKMLSTQDKEIDLLKQKLELVKTQKKGLMQNLLTGKIRVKTS